MWHAQRQAFLARDGALVFVWTLYVLAVAGAFTVILAIQTQVAQSAVYGLGAGLLLAALAARVAYSFLLGLAPADPVAFGVATAAIACTTAASAPLPSLKALRLDLAVLLRSDG